MSLPLTIRKNIRDNEPKLKENLEVINTATGKEWSVEVDWAANLSQLEGDSTKNNIGSLYYDDVLGYLAKNIQKLCTQETAKEAFLEATSSNKILIKVNEKLSRYWEVSFANGDLILTHKKSIANISEVQYFDMIAVIPVPGIPLQSKLNLEKHQENLTTNLERINAATGVSDWTLEVDLPSLLPQLDKSSQLNIGELYYDSVMSYFASNLEKTLKDEMVKEAFNEATSERKIEIIINDKQSDYWDINFKNGGIVISHKKSIANLSNIQYYNLTPKIPSPGMSLVIKVNLAKEDNQTALKNALDRINAATGTEDWAFEADYPAILPQLDKNTQERIGDIYMDDAMGYLSKCLEEKLKLETTKEAFNEATSSRKVIFRCNDKIKDYWNIKFENGNLVTEHKKSIANLSNLQYFPLETVIPTPGLSLVVRLNLEKHRPKLEENLAQIAEATGSGDWTFEADFDALVPQLDPNTQNNIGETYYDSAMGYLASNIKKQMEKETVKEAFNEATSERKITFLVNDKQNKYWDIVFKNGGLIVSHKKSIANLSELQYFPMERIIPVPGTLSLVSKLNIEEYRPKLEEHLQTIKTATGEDYTFDDSCIEALYPKLDQNQKDQFGSLFFDDVMGYLAKNLEKSLADEMVKEAFNEVTSAHQVTIRQKKPTPNYWSISFENGVIVLSFEGLANLSNIQYFNIEPLL